MKLSHTPDTSPLLTPENAGFYLSRPPAALAQLRYRGTGPLYIKTGRLVRYRLTDLEAWVAAGERSAT